MKRFNVMDNEYRYDRLIFWCAATLILSFAVFIAWQNSFTFGQTKIYIECEGPGLCTNPLVENPHHYIEDCQQQLRILFFIPLYTAEDCKQNCVEEWCTEPLLKPGSYGTPPDPRLKQFPLFILITFLASFLLNHMIYNRGMKPKLELNLKPSTKRKLKKMFEAKDKLEED